ncbi:MAG: type V CRISPR-associated protein Cas12k [Drouetiella hepatica Uher 2000/2452]|uniref:Type V CRISPR-associated protein Cas12k n=1 Tax=Drouetiella hepatica Uher 2000/2452 TaxID=904376 RepID=A0A951QGC2_9CYAN|nr:type V CRISPR-associated protein Cas12k [Drouetiella hepatica Uher 2000/2452]
MSQSTIQCQLTANEATRSYLWALMAEKNTPLINELIGQVTKHSDFETWKLKGKIPSSVVSQLCQPLKTDPRFIGQPARFYTSATHVVDYTFKSWLALQKRLSDTLQRKIRWSEMLKSDPELVELSGCNLATIRAKAAEILAVATNKSQQGGTEPSQKTRKSKQPKDSAPGRTVSSLLFEAHRNTQDILSQCAICYLLKNSCKVSDREEDPDKFAKRRRKVEIQIQRLQDQIEGRLPKGRDLTGQSWLNTLAIATSTVPVDNAEAKRWQDKLLTQSTSLPFPVSFETNEDLVWSNNQKGRISVRLNGLGEHTFQIACDQRQLPWFKRFLEDQQTKREGKNQHSSALFALRSGRLAWQEGKEKGEPWKANRLILYCTVDTRLWTAEGTEQVRNEKAIEIAQTLTRMKEKEGLSQTQQDYIKRLDSSLTRINSPFDRPSQSLYQPLPHILVGICLGLEQPATVVVLDINTNQVLTHRTVRQLLGRNYALLLKRRREQQRTAHQRHKAQKRDAPRSLGESELGQYVDRLLAKATVELARTHRASSIVVPKLGDMREIVQSEIQAKAEQKIPGSIEAQQKYAKQYRINVHRWSYSRLIESIRAQAAKDGIALEEGRQPLQGSLEERAKGVAIAAYQSRKK